MVEVRYGCMMLHGTWFCLPLSTACSSLHASLRYVACSLMCSGALFTFGHLGAISPQRTRLHAIHYRDELGRDRRTVWTQNITRFQKFVQSCVWCFFFSNAHGKTADKTFVGLFNPHGLPRNAALQCFECTYRWKDVTASSLVGINRNLI